MTSENKLKCSFCGKTQDIVKKLIAGPGVYVCDECVGLCNQILEEEGLYSSSSAAAAMRGIPSEPEESPHPLKSVPAEVIDSSLKYIQSLIDSYETFEKQTRAEPLYRSLLLLQESQLGSTDLKLSDTLEKLCEIYEKQRRYDSSVHALKWIVLIMDANNSSNRKKASYLHRLAKMHIKLNQQSEAESVLDRIAELDTN